jgi:hypothetical protein
MGAWLPPFANVLQIGQARQSISGLSLIFPAASVLLPFRLYFWWKKSGNAIP